MKPESGETVLRSLVTTALFALGLLTLGASDAHATSVRSIPLDQEQQLIQLNDHISHTIYEDRIVRRTCYRDVLVGYRRVCRERPPVCHNEEQCRDIPYEVCEGKGRDRKCETRYRRVCRTIQKCHRQEPVCHNEPIYRREAYDCSYRETIPVGTELDYEVQANVEVRVNNTTGISGSGELLQLELDGAQLKAVSTRSSGELVLLARRSVRTTVLREDHGPHSPGLIQVDGLIDIVAMSKTDALAILAGGVRNLELTEKSLTATVGENMVSELVVPKLKITRHKAVVKDKRLVDRKLVSSEYELIDRGDHTEVRIELDRLLMSEAIQSGKTYQAELTISLESRDGLEILNAKAFGDLKATGKVRVKMP